MERPETIRLTARSTPIDALVRLPGSKSLTNRALLLAALANGESRLDGVLLADDTRLMIDAIRSLGVPIRIDESRRNAVVTGCAGRWPNAEANLFCGNAGTVLRFLTAACTIDNGHYRLDGVQRMRERPIDELVDCLRDLGAQIGYEVRQGYCPLTIHATGLRGGGIERSSTVSSQYVSALLMAGALASNDVMIGFDQPLPSRPYVAMTMQVMHAFDVGAVDRDLMRFIVPGRQTYRATNYAVEPDASAASYFFAAAAVTGGRVTVDGLGADSCQGDVGFVRVLEQMGCSVDQDACQTTVKGPAAGRLHGVDVDLGDMPDVAQTLAVIAAFADGPTHIRNVGNLRIKETDRLAALASELGAMQVDTETRDDGISIIPNVTPKAARIRTYNDHRMAMSFAVAGLRLDGMEIENPSCVNKTFPDFFNVWNDLK
ncbi:MAG: 3-phosphoshikimate 1-carboxyvinyltransferase [Phycisphaerales bacterium]|nr:3-phosphoshikimate 1-carboxyvinyltransferase [Phycisphaerales bacterium]MCB9864883.1 3-phosphoshikimate 1-carboxyvinyltransferase [Phycisphaerales bacterium]